MSKPMKRRAFLSGVAATACLAGSSAEADAVDDGSNASEEAAEWTVKMEWLKPREIDEALKACPTLFQPLGTIEWHGLHNVVGVDALKAHALCVQAAVRGGGLVAPPLYGGVGGLDQPHTFVMEPENDVFSNLLRPWLEQLCREAVRQGFRAVIMLTGHYGAAQQIVVRETASRMTRALGVPILGTPEYILALDAGYLGDHAAWGETSLMMHYAGDSVDLSRLGEAPHQGVGGRDPRQFASAADGKRLAETIVARLASLARQMHEWDEATVARFAEAEATLVGRQLTMAGRKGNPWAAWRKIGHGVLNGYADALIKRKFDDIIAMAEGL